MPVAPAPVPPEPVASEPVAPDPTAVTSTRPAATPAPATPAPEAARPEPPPTAAPAEPSRQGKAEASRGATAKGDAKDGLAALIAALGEGDVRQREAVIDRIGSMGPRAQAAIEALVAAARDDNAAIRWHAVRAIGMIGENAATVIPDLVSLLSDADPVVVTHAAHAIGLVRGTIPVSDLTADHAAAFNAAVEPLIEATLHADPRVRRAAIASLRSVSTAEQLVPLVNRHLADADPSVVLPALHTLADMGGQAVPFLLEALGEPGSRYWATVALAEMGPQAAPAVPQLTALARDAEFDERLQAIYALAGIGEAAQEAGPVLAEALDGKEPLLRFAAAHALGRIRSGAADDALARAATDDDALLAEIASWARARIQPDDEVLVATAIEKLEKGLNADEPFVRAASVTGLSDLAEFLDEARQRRLAGQFALSLDDPDDGVSLRAGGALVRLGRQAVGALKERLADASARPRVLEVLAAIGADASAALPELETALSDPDPAIRSEAAFALGAVGAEGASLVPNLAHLLADDQPNEVRYTAAYALGRMGAAAAPASERLAELVKSADDLMATVAVWAALKIRPDDRALFTEAIPLLERALESERELARLEAAVSLGEIGAAAKAAVPALETVADNDPVQTVREAAASALKRIRAD